MEGREYLWSAPFQLAGFAQFDAAQWRLDGSKEIIRVRMRMQHGTTLVIFSLAKDFPLYRIDIDALARCRRFGCRSRPTRAMLRISRFIRRRYRVVSL